MFRRAFRSAAFAALLLAPALFVAGCAKPAPTPPKAAPAAKVITPAELAAALAGRDRLQQQLWENEAVRQKLQAELVRLNAVSEELDATKRALADAQMQTRIRTSERDALQAQFDGFRKHLRAQLAQFDGTLTLPTPRPVSATPASAPARDKAEAKPQG